MKIILYILTALIVHDTFGQIVDGDNLKKQMCYDSTLNGMILRNPESVERIFRTQENLIDEDDEMTDVISKDGNQLLTMVFLPGDVINQFSQSKVEFNTLKKESKWSVGQREFVTGKGIKLGTIEKELIKALGQPKEIRTENNLTVYLYRQEGGGLYFGNYYFKDGRLIKFWFGEEYP